MGGNNVFTSINFQLEFIISFNYECRQTTVEFNRACDLPLSRDHTFFPAHFINCTWYNSTSSMWQRLSDPPRDLIIECINKEAHILLCHRFLIYSDICVSIKSVSFVSLCVRLTMLVKMLLWEGDTDFNRLPIGSMAQHTKGRESGSLIDPNSLLYPTLNHTGLCNEWEINHYHVKSLICEENSAVSPL